MAIDYETDVVAWAYEQAALLRAGRFSEIDTFNVAEEIEDVARTERRELGNHLKVLIAHLLKWKYQPSHRGTSWTSTIDLQRDEVHYALRKMPSLKHALEDEEWLGLVWRRAVKLAEKEAGLDLPEQWIWTLGEVLDDDFWPYRPRSKCRLDNDFWPD